MTTTGLQCPGCGHIHPLAEVPGEGRFRCAGCNRLLSVPESMESSPPFDPDATQSHPAAQPRRSGGGSTAAAPTVPTAPHPVSAWVRAPVWILALGLGFLASAVVMRTVGLLDVDSVLDAFAGEGVGRYAVLLAFLPLWALLSGGAAHVVLEWLGGRRERTKQERPSPDQGDAGKSEKAQSRKDERARRAV